MSGSEDFRVGLVGAAGRGGSFRTALAAGGARVTAVCDIRQDALAECMKQTGAAEAYADYEDIMRWLGGFKKPPRMTFLVHGEKDAANALGKRIVDQLGWKIAVPKYLEKFEL